MRRALDLLRHGPESWVQMLGVAALSLPLAIIVWS